MSDLEFVLCLAVGIIGLSVSMFSLGWTKCLMHLNKTGSKKEMKDQGKHETTDADPATKRTVK